MAKGDTYQHIIDSALALVAEYGLEKASLSMIANKAGISKPAIYYYFSSKEALLDHLFHLLFDDYQFDNYFPLDTYTKDNFSTLLTDNGLQLLQEYDENPELLKIINHFIVYAGQKQAYDEKLKQTLTEFLDGFKRLLIHGQQLGVIKTGDVTAKAQLLGLVLDNISSYLLMGIKVESTAVWTQAVSYVMGDD
ncbi:TetR/AcrR family transcriptional regulator [Terribacillus saccharophilus]|uniref:TetR/AcrR family transcriptional regulator n=1 Tax=Terribacillus saccharophilus TaxID=361277 RepID=UPI000C9AED2B|nr:MULTISPECIES: TetR/AcrR family transcriptional regulator [Terribacillus]MCM3226925.1 TetR/AcrR family transcriptional regulator [Terribacillus saccharophilus]MEC0284323.1 TetR/AcrR family transcriptional regulator [Terribacillus saccharophilus]MEC0291001.1 TetR/AcrR family transcriptional regulator [Terribacillus saccharophilus]